MIIEDGVAKLPDRSAFAGSVSTADRLVRTMIQAGQSLTDTIRMITQTPAAIMGIGDRKGAIAKGYDADIIIFDEDINIYCTIAGGEIVYQKERLCLSIEDPPIRKYPPIPSKDNVYIRIFDSRDQLGEAAAKAVAATIQKLLETQPTLNMASPRRPRKTSFSRR